MKIKAMAAALCVAALALTSCGIEDGSGSSADGKTLNLQTVFAANTVDAQLNRTSFIMNSGTTETLIGLDKNTNKLYGWLADEWSSEDAQNWTFHIREGVKFHNGKDVTAEAVKKSLEHGIEVNPGVATALKAESIEADGQTLKIRTTQKYASLPSELVHYNNVITDVDASTDFPIGTGAFKFESFDIKGAARLTRFDDYWDGKAKLDSVTMTANEDANARMLSLQSGQSDVIYRPSLESLDAISKDSNLAVDAVPGSRVYHLIYNYKGAHANLWNNIEFRKGVDTLVDREAIAKTILRGRAVVTDNPFPGDLPTSPKQLESTYNPEKALEHFKAAGLEVKDGKLAEPISMKLATYNARPELPQIAQAFQDSAAKVGLNMEIHNAENIDEYLAGDDWDVATFSLATLTRGDGSYFVNGAFMPDGAQNYGGVDDPELIAKISTFNETVNEDERATQMREIAEDIRSKAYNCYIVSPYETAAYKKTVTGWFTPSNEFEFQMVTKDLDIE